MNARFAKNVVAATVGVVVGHTAAMVVVEKFGPVYRVRKARKDRMAKIIKELDDIKIATDAIMAGDFPEFFRKDMLGHMVKQSAALSLELIELAYNRPSYF
jgi:hypothetical protein